MSPFLLEYILLVRSYLAQILSTLAGRLSPTSPSHLLSPDTDLEPYRKWLESIIISSADVAIPADAGLLLKSVRIDPLGANRGLAGTIYRILLEYSVEDDRLPRSLIVKTSKDGVSGRMSVIRSQHRESIFYSSDLTSTTDSRDAIFLIPKIYYSYYSCIFGEIVIIMEDLLPPKTSSDDENPKNVGVNMICGNQIWGRSKDIDWEREYDLGQVISEVYRAAADFHAVYWKNPKLISKDSHGKWLKGAGWYRGENRSEWESAVAKSYSAWTTFLHRIESSPNPDLNLSPNLIELITNSFKNASWDEMQREISDPSRPFTLCHGDFHASNMIYIASKSGSSSKSTHPIRIHDWSEVGPWEPMTDLSQMVISDLHRDLYRKELLPTAVRAYWERLTSSGHVSPSEYTFEMCWRSFRTGGLERWVFIFPLLVSFPQIPAVAIQYFHDQMCAFVEAFVMEDGRGVWPKSLVLKTVVSV